MDVITIEGEKYCMVPIPGHWYGKIVGTEGAGKELPILPKRWGVRLAQVSYQEEIYGAVHGQILSGVEKLYLAVKKKYYKEFIKAWEAICL